jgi:CRP/FNR family cyclic AMP-dependent transcriptional regulator
MNTIEYVKQFPLKRFEQAEVLLKKGDSLDHLLVVREGFVKITSINDNGSERLLWIAGRYDVIPTEQLFSIHAKVRYFYTGLTSGTCYAVNKKDFVKTALSSPEIMTDIAKSMSSHYDEFLQLIDAVDTATVKEKLMRTLLYLADRISGSPVVDLYAEGLRLTHQDLAAMIGSTRETASLTLAQLRKEQLLHYTRKEFVVHSDALRALLGE